jgi:hypothetical protein
MLEIWKEISVVFIVFSVGIYLELLSIVLMLYVLYLILRNTGNKGGSYSIFDNFRQIDGSLTQEMVDKSLRRQ